MRWMLGLTFATASGYVITGGFLYGVRRAIRLGPKPPGNPIRVPPGLTGIVERLVFAFFVATGASSVPSAMMAWLAIKLATNWNRDIWNPVSTAGTFALTALLAGLLSIRVALTSAA